MSLKIQSLIGEAVNLYQNGLAEDAKTTLQQVLKLQKNNLPALEILGLINATSGAHLEATKYLKKAVQINPNNPSTQYNLAKALVDSGDLSASLPHHEKAIKLAPHNVDAWINYGKTLSLQGRHRDALLAFDKVISIEPGHSEIKLNRGIALRGLGLSEDALQEFNKLLELSPNHYLALVNKGITLIQKKSFSEGIALLDNALAINPVDVTSLLSKGQALYEQKMYVEALSTVLDALKIEPTSAEVNLNIGSILNELKRYEEAISYFNEATNLNPNKAEAYSNKGLAYYELKEYNESLVNYEKAYSIDPTIDFLLGSLLKVKLLLGDWSGIETEIAALTTKLSESKKTITPFTLMALIDSPKQHLQAGKIWSSLLDHIHELRDDRKRDCKASDKVRIAYFSADFKEHPVAHLTAELFQLHDRNKFEVLAISLDSNPLSNPMRERLKSVFDQFIETTSQTDEQIAKLCRDLEIDISIDLGGYTESSRPGIFRYRTAPIQVNYLGYPGTLGSSCFEYIIADHILIPELDRGLYVEKIAYLPNSYMVDDSMRLPSNTGFARNEFGLPEDAFVYCCFNNGYKFNKLMIKRWSNILMQVEGSVLWLPENNPTFQHNLLNEFHKYGIESNRILFAKRMPLMSDHLARLKLADLFLDTHPFNAHTTAIDALKSGLPVISMLGNSFPARVAGSLLNAIDLPELIAQDSQNYELLAIELGKNQNKIQAIKNKLLSNIETAPLFNSKLFTRNIESLFLKMHERYVNKLPADHIF